MESVLLSIFVGVMIRVIFMAIEKTTYHIIGKMQQKKNDAPPKDHRS